MSERDHARQLIDRLPDAQVTALVGLLEAMIHPGIDPVAAAVRHAEIDDEPESEQEKQSVSEAHEWLQRNGGKGIPHSDAMRRLGLE